MSFIHRGRSDADARGHEYPRDAFLLNYIGAKTHDAAHCAADHDFEERPNLKREAILELYRNGEKVGRFKIQRLTLLFPVLIEEEKP